MYFQNLLYFLSPIFVHSIFLYPPTNCDDLKTYTTQEKDLIPKLYARIVKNLTQDVMHEDKYIVRFLRAQDHNLERAETMIRENLEYRRENRMDSIDERDWSNWKRQIPFTLNITDYEGRPTLAAGLGRGDIRKILLHRRGGDLNSYIAYVIEKGLHNIHRTSNTTGKEFIEAWFLFDLAGFSQRQHACPQCIPMWIQWLQIYESYFPQSAKATIVVNAPRLFPRIYHLVKPIMSAHTAKGLKVYDFNKAVWKEELLKIFPENKLPLEFGGKAN